MEYAVFKLFYMVAVGFVAAGVVASFVQLISGEPMRFGVEAKTLISSIAEVSVRALAGPAILMRNAWRGAKIEARPPYWLGLSAAIAGVWSLFSGAILLDLITRL